MLSGYSRPSKGIMTGCEDVPFLSDAEYLIVEELLKRWSWILGLASANNENANFFVLSAGQADVCHYTIDCS